MRKKFIFSLILLFYIFRVNAQSITISYLPDSKRGDSSIASPYSPVDEYSYCQTIYLQNEIQGSGFITGLTYYYPDTSLKNSDYLEIFIGNTNLDDMDSAYIIKRSLMKRVFNG